MWNNEKTGRSLDEVEYVGMITRNGCRLLAMRLR